MPPAPTESAHATAVPGRLAQGVVAVFVLAALVHTTAIGVWAAPANPVGEAVGRDRLSAYILPWWAQSWSIFAPVPLRADWTMRMRAKVQDPVTGRIRVTAWTDLTSTTTANPARAQLAARLIARSRNDDLQIRYVTEYARRVNQGRVVAVEFDRGYRRVPVYAGHTIDFDDVAPESAKSGWRTPR